MLRLFDKHNRDITGETEYCEHPACLGEPWCSAWGICKTAQEPQQRASTSQMQATPSGLLGEEDIDQLLHELGQQLDSTNYTQLPLSSSPPHLPEPSVEALPEVHSSPTPLAPLQSLLTPAPPSKSRFAVPKTAQEVLEARDKGVPEKTRKDTLYCCRVWEAWRDNREAHFGHKHINCNKNNGDS